MVLLRQVLAKLTSTNLTSHACARAPALTDTLALPVHSRVTAGLLGNCRRWTSHLVASFVLCVARRVVAASALLTPHTTRHRPAPSRPVHSRRNVSRRARVRADRPQHPEGLGQQRVHRNCFKGDRLSCCFLRMPMANVHADVLWCVPVPVSLSGSAPAPACGCALSLHPPLLRGSCAVPLHAAPAYVPVHMCMPVSLNVSFAFCVRICLNFKVCVLALSFICFVPRKTHLPHLPCDEQCVARLARVCVPFLFQRQCACQLRRQLLFSLCLCGVACEHGRCFGSLCTHGGPSLG